MQKIWAHLPLNSKVERDSSYYNRDITEKLGKFAILHTILHGDVVENLDTFPNIYILLGYILHTTKVILQKIWVHFSSKRKGCRPFIQR